MFSIFKRKGKSLSQQRQNDFAYAKGAIKKGEKLSKRDKQLIAVGRTQVHLQQSDVAAYNKATPMQAAELVKANQAIGSAKKSKNGAAVALYSDQKKRIKKAIFQKKY